MARGKLWSLNGTGRNLSSRPTHLDTEENSGQSKGLATSTN